MSTNFYSSIDVQTRERLSLQPGSYGTSSLPGLKILAYIEKSSKPDKNGAMMHSFLVAATRPSREALQDFESQRSNGKTAASGDNPLPEPDYEGTAFMRLTLDEVWTSPEPIALAFSEASRNKEGVIQKDFVAQAIAAGQTNEANMQRCRIHFQNIAADKVAAANTPEESVAEAVETQYRKELQQISIKIGQFFTLLDWRGAERDPHYDVHGLVGCEFSGKVEAQKIGTGSEVTSIYSKKK
jgi:hypothetical protein